MKRTVFYARVSTNHQVQSHSLKQQREFFMNYIQSHPQYIYSGEYIDEGISGTSLKKRESFNRMIEDAINHQFDLILVKDISRFSRNTLDTIEQTRKLKMNGIDVIFINDHIDTSQSNSEVNLTLLATMAQEESRKISHRVNWGMRRDMEKGVMFIESIYGYNIENRTLVINKEQAKVIRLIYHLYLNGNGYYRIVKKLMDFGIKSPKGKDVWNVDTVRNILINEKYVGTLVSGKTHVQDFISKKQIKVDKKDWFIFFNHHEPIIEIETFNQVQKLIEIKQKKYKHDHPKKDEKRMNNKIICDMCQGYYQFDSSKSRMYCYNIQYHLCCNHHSIRVSEMKEMLRVVFDDILIDKIKIQEKVIKILNVIVSSQKSSQCSIEYTKKISKLHKNLDQHLNELLSGKITENEYKQMETQNIKEIQKLKIKIFQSTQIDQTTDLEGKIQDIKEELLDTLNDSEWLLIFLIDRFVDRIAFRNRNDFDIYFHFNEIPLKIFDKTLFHFLLDINYDFSYLESPYTRKKYKILKNTKIRIFQLGEKTVCQN